MGASAAAALLLALFAFRASTTLAIVAPNTSLATVPCAYFGGNYARRGDANIAMLAKMRLVMLEKWEGSCWQDCLGNGTGSVSCQAGCGVEDYIIDTHRRIKALNPGVSGVLYWNTLLAFLLPGRRAVRGRTRAHGRQRHGQAHLDPQRQRHGGYRRVRLRHGRRRGAVRGDRQKSDDRTGNGTGS